MTTGPDGALWFTEWARNVSQIGRITTTGTITEYATTAQSSPAGITRGPDGALWFVENGNAQAIGRITTAGVFTHFAILGAGASQYFTVGSDGALWFTVYLGNKIGRITTAGAFTEFTVPTANSRPNGITAGPDGALWFTELQGNKIGRITTAGVITEFTVPTANSSPFGITAGPDGALWFAEAGASKVGRLVLPETLTVAPTTNIAASGVQGGPFSPSSFSYQLSATSGSVNYSIAGVPKWLTASSTSGTATTSAKTVTFAVNSTAKTLAPNSYINNIDFNNATNKRGDATRTATLTVRPIEFTITVGASPVADGAVGGGGTFAQGCSCAVTATPRSGFKFVDWTEQGTVVSTAEKYTFTLEADVVLLAHFEP